MTIQTFATCSCSRWMLRVSKSRPPLMAHRLLSCSAPGPPHLILLDLWMPGMDGWAFRSQQLTREALASIPVVVLTAGRILQSRVDQLQAAAIVPKPFNLDALLGLT